MSSYMGVRSVAEKIDKLYVGDGAGIAMVAQKAYAGNQRGVAELWYQAGKPIGDLLVGSVVYFSVGGVRTPWIVIQNGVPNIMYEGDRTGTWLLMKDIYKKNVWDKTGYNNYGESTIHTYLNGEFLDLLDPKVKAAVKQMKIPYRKGQGTSTTVTSGANGLAAKIFLLSATETSFNFSGMPVNEGIELSYFRGCSDSGTDAKRVANADGSPAVWWLRSPQCNSFGKALSVHTNGTYAGNSVGVSYGIRPALVLARTALVDDQGNVLGE